MIFSRIKTYLAVLGTFLAGLVVFYIKGMRDGRRASEDEHVTSRIDDMLEAKKVEEYVESLDDEQLTSRASKWVRGSNGR
jgi:hypothetical protein